VVAFLGDDYTTGAGASSPAKRFSTLVSQQLGVVEKNFGIAGAGHGGTVPDDVRRCREDDDRRHDRGDCPRPAAHPTTLLARPAGR
jgi:hypothetical protein